MRRQSTWSSRFGETGTGCCWRSTDDGVGFDPEAPESRSRQLGLTSMEERAQRLGGTLEIDSAPGVGTTVRLKVADG